MKQRHAALLLLALAAPLAALAGSGNCAPDAAEFCRLNGAGRWCLPCDAAMYVTCPADEAQGPKVERCTAGARVRGAAACGLPPRLLRLSAVQCRELP